MIFIQRMSPIAKAQLNSCDKRIVRLTHAGDAAILICKSWDSLNIISFKSWMRCISWSVLYQVLISGSICGSRLMNAGGRVVGWRDPSHWTASHRGQHQPLLHHRSNPFQLRNSFTAAMHQAVERLISGCHKTMGHVYKGSRGLTCLYKSLKSWAASI